MPFAAGQAGNGVAWSALALWVATASVGLSLVTIWMGRGGPGQLRSAQSRLRPWLVVSHIVVAVTALGVWVAYLIFNRRGLAVAAVIMLVAVAALGTTSFVIWQRRRIGVLRATEDSWDLPPEILASDQIPAEQHFPVAVVVIHGVLAVGTVALVAVLALGAVDRSSANETRTVAASPPAPTTTPAPAATTTPPPTTTPAPSPAPNSGTPLATVASTRFRLALTPACVPRSGRLTARLRVSGGAAGRGSRRAAVTHVVFTANPGDSSAADRGRPYIVRLRVRPADATTIRAHIAATRGLRGPRLRIPTLNSRLGACS